MRADHQPSPSEPSETLAARCGVPVRQPFACHAGLHRRTRTPTPKPMAAAPSSTPEASPANRVSRRLVAGGAGGIAPPMTAGGGGSGGSGGGGGGGSGGGPPAGDGTTATDATVTPIAWVRPARCMLITTAVVFIA